LLDGLDEVRAQDHDRVLNIIRQTSERFDRNQFVLTCRIAAKEHTFDRFTEVEVADFDDNQITDFANKWFQSKDPILDNLKAKSVVHARTSGASLQSPDSDFLRPKSRRGSRLTARLRLRCAFRSRQ
jgi:predicted NACHT family NTPase